jgi:hypothetical protein
LPKQLNKVTEIANCYTKVFQKATIVKIFN